LTVFELELRGALANRRLFALNTIVPLAIVGPVAAGAAPPAHAAMVFTLLFTFFGTFGQAIPLARDAETGLIARLLLTGMPPRAFFLQRVAAHAIIDWVQLAPALLIIAVAYGVPATGVPALGLATLLALVAANALGACLAAAARSIAEAALFSAVTALLALHAAGVFRTPADGSLAAHVQSVLPFAGLHSVMSAATRPSVAPGAATDWLAFVTGVVALLGVMTLAATWLSRAMTRVARV
jgi:ABC-2 type transport system permease protein